MFAHNIQLNTVRVYLSTFDRAVVVSDVLPATRNEVIQRCTDTLTKQQRYCVWKLLDKALYDCYGLGVSELDFTLDDNGKWSCSNGVHFSLSHCNNVVAVAVCGKPVGMDVQTVASFVKRVDDGRFAKRVLTESERQTLVNIPAKRRVEALAKMWTGKESLFKLQGGSAFVPGNIDTIETQGKLRFSQVLTINGEMHALSVATDETANAEVVFVQI